jgi:DnaJ-class molecular chaperone
MFIDYYKILNITKQSNDTDIRLAYRREAFKWHPDRNAQCDTTAKMQEINEAYLILSDQEARERYNREYDRYYQKFNHSAADQSEYVFEDSILKDWIISAKSQAIDLAKETMEDIVGITKVSSKAIYDGIKYWVLFYIVFTAAVIIYLYS